MMLKWIVSLITVIAWTVTHAQTAEWGHRGSIEAGSGLPLPENEFK